MLSWVRLHSINVHSFSPPASHSASWHQFILLGEQGHIGIRSLSRAIGKKVGILETWTGALRLRAQACDHTAIDPPISYIETSCNPQLFDYQKNFVLESDLKKYCNKYIACNWNYNTRLYGFKDQLHRKKFQKGQSSSSLPRWCCRVFRCDKSSLLSGCSPSESLPGKSGYNFFGTSGYFSPWKLWNTKKGKWSLYSWGTNPCSEHHIHVIMYCDALPLRSASK